MIHRSYLVHPCEKEEKGGCSDICKKNGLSVTCSCPEEYELMEDKKTCKKGMIMIICISNQIIVGMKH